MSPELDARLQRLKGELDDHARIASHLGLDFERPIRSLDDGYPENAISWVGKITERILKQLWRHHEVPGDPSQKSLSELINGCRPHVRSGTVLDALRDIQRLRNRSAHDGYEVAEEDGLAAVRRLLDVLVWFASIGSEAITGEVPRLTPLVARKAEFLAGLHVTMGYRLTKRFELSSHTVYQLFCRETGLRSEYVELLLSRDGDEVRQVLETTGGELLQTQLPKLTRFLVLEEGGRPDAPASLGEDYRVVTYERFMDTIVDLEQHLASVLGSYPTAFPDEPAELLPIAGELLAAGEFSGEMAVSRVGDAAELVEEVAVDGGNLLVVGRSGSGKTMLLNRLAAAGRTAGTRRYRFYFDMSRKWRDEDFKQFVTRALAPCMNVEDSHVFDVFHYFIRSGSVVCVLDGIDEAVGEATLSGFLALFTELTQVLSAESAVVMSSRVSFLEDSPQVRRLLDGTSLISQQLVQQLHAEGVDPLRIPRFSALRLHDVTSSQAPTGSPLELRLAGKLVTPAGDALSTLPALAELLWTHIRYVTAAAGIDALLPRLVSFFGAAYLRGRTTFSIVEVCNELGIDCFEGSRLDYAALRLRPLFRPVSEGAVAFIHVAYQELLAAEYLRDPEARESAAAVEPRPLLTEQLRAFLQHRFGAAGGESDDCVLPAGVYLIGPSHHLMLRRIGHPARVDRYPVTVRRYKRFLAAVAAHGSRSWDHPDMPADYTHDPWYERLRLAGYYDDPAYADYPAVCVNWWSAYAFARFEGKRLPTSLEWEAAARGADGRLFPWGDDLDLSAVNCADSWSGRPLVTYDAWKHEHDRGGLGDALPSPVDAHHGNRSPFGVREMAGNVWELTATVLDDTSDVVICGGSFDNPSRAVQASSKGLYRRRGASNVVGFRCIEDFV